MVGTNCVELGSRRKRHQSIQNLEKYLHVLTWYDLEELRINSKKLQHEKLRQMSKELFKGI